MFFRYEIIGDVTTPAPETTTLKAQSAVEYNGEGTVKWYRYMQMNDPVLYLTVGCGVPVVSNRIVGGTQVSPHRSVQIHLENLDM